MHVSFRSGSSVVDISCFHDYFGVFRRMLIWLCQFSHLSSLPCIRGGWHTVGLHYFTGWGRFRIDLEVSFEFVLLLFLSFSSQEPLTARLFDVLIVALNRTAWGVKQNACSWPGKMYWMPNTAACVASHFAGYKVIFCAEYVALSTIARLFPSKYVWSTHFFLLHLLAPSLTSTSTRSKPVCYIYGCFYSAKCTLLSIIQWLVGT